MYSGDLAYYFGGQRGEVRFVSSAFHNISDSSELILSSGAHRDRAEKRYIQAAESSRHTTAVPLPFQHSSDSPSVKTSQVLETPKYLVTDSNLTVV